MEDKSNVLVFTHPDFESVRVVTIDDEPWFVGSDIAKALGYSNPHKAVSRHCKYGMKRPIGVVTGQRSNGTDIVQNIDIIVIPESDLYRLTMRSQLPSAEKFADWVVEEVLPTIRKTGKYDLTESYKIDDPIERARAWIKEQEEKRQLEAQNTVLVAENEEMKPKARIYDNLIDSRLLTNFRDAAKEIGISQTQFTGWLKENGYVYANSKGELRPMERYMESGLFQMKPYSNPYNGFASNRTFLTPTGLATFKIMIEDSGHTRHTMKKHGGRNSRQRKG